ncbi:flagellar basal body P-ring formation chaperone FlgA [Vibrio quintilis]|uniref:flagellar basal body P-ring formation chaperone FlgA n=1 Tax=Vibrio quintilis TaxID=1117707 RepID=UPI00352170CC
MVLFSAPALAVTQAEKAIHQAVTAHLQQELKEAARQYKWKKYTHHWDIWIPASASHLPLCQTKLTVSSRDNQQWPVGRLKRQVQCNDPQHSWRLTVTVKASLTLPVVVIKQQVKRGNTVSAPMLKLEKRTLTRETSFLTRITQAKGKTATRRLRAGQIVNPVWLEKPPLVKKGNLVLIIASKDGVSASTRGTALEQGGKGDQIKVENMKSKKIIRAVVTGINEVHTQF